jgi:hypothetical protein
MVDAKVPYAITLGNHDHQANLDQEQLVTLDMQQPLSLTQRGPPGLPGVSNYILDIFPSKEEHAASRPSTQIDQQNSSTTRGILSTNSSSSSKNSSLELQRPKPAAQIYMLDSEPIICQQGWKQGTGCCETLIPSWMLEVRTWRSVPVVGFGGLLHVMGVLILQLKGVMGIMSLDTSPERLSCGQYFNACLLLSLLSEAQRHNEAESVTQHTAKYGPAKSS